MRRSESRAWLPSRSSSCLRHVSRRRAFELDAFFMSYGSMPRLRASVTPSRSVCRQRAGEVRHQSAASAAAPSDARPRHYSYQYTPAGSA